MSNQEQWAAMLAMVAEPAPNRSRRDGLIEALQLGLDISPAMVGCSFTEVEGSGFATPAAVNELALSLDQVQYEAGTGPCVVAARERQHQALDDIASEQRYPAFVAAAARHGVSSSLSLPLPAADRPSALNLYASAAGAFADDRAQAVADLLVRCVSALLAPDAETRAEFSSRPELTSARQQGAIVRQAEEQLMRARGLNRPAAFGVLAERSRVEQRFIHQIATDLLNDHEEAS